MIPRDRCAYSAIVDRPPLFLPNRARIVVWTIVNLEFWDISRPMARQVLPAPTGQVLLPDVPNWAWHEYGMRVGVWRFFELFARLAIRPTLSINARVCEEYERVARAAREAGWEFMGHAWEQMPIHKVEDQFGTSGRRTSPVGAGSTCRAMRREIDQNSRLTIVHTTRRAPFGSLSGGRSTIAE